MSAIRKIGFGLLALLMGVAAGWWSGDSGKVAKKESGAAPTSDVQPGTGNTGPSTNQDPESIFEGLVTATRDAGEHFQGRLDLCRLVERIGRAQMPSLIARARKLPPKYEKELVPILLERWFEMEKGAAEQWLRANAEGSDELARIWARFSPETALREMLASSNWYWRAPSTALDQLAGRDPKARIALLTSLPQSRNRDLAMESEIRDWAEKDPSNAFQAAQTMITGPDKTRAEEEILCVWAGSDPMAAIKMARSTFPNPKSGISGDEFTTHFTEVLAQKDPTAAMDFAMHLDQKLQEYPLLAAVAGWAKSDPMAALTWSYENGLEIARDIRWGQSSSDETVLSEALSSQPDATVQWLLAQPPDAARGRALRSAGENLLEKTPPEELLAPDGTLLHNLYDNLPPAEQKRLASEIGARAAKDGDFPELTVWTARFGDGPVRAAAIGSAVGVIFNDNPEKADKIIAGLPTGPDRDRAIASIVDLQSETRPVAAQRAMLIGDETLRRDEMDDLITSWLRWDGDACRSWLANAKDVPAEWVTDWLKREAVRD
ncbi:MAG TPA: hypothetical protein VGH90_10120 [Chthoniobacteraceae bacterium]